MEGFGKFLTAIWLGFTLAVVVLFALTIVVTEVTK